MAFGLMVMVSVSHYRWTPQHEVMGTWKLTSRRALATVVKPEASYGGIRKFKEIGR